MGDNKRIFHVEAAPKGLAQSKKKNMYKRNRVFLGQNRISRSQGTLFTSPKLQHSPGRCRGNCCSYAHICENYKYLLENFTFRSAISIWCQWWRCFLDINFLPEIKEARLYITLLLMNVGYKNECIMDIKNISCLKKQFMHNEVCTFHYNLIWLHKSRSYGIGINKFFWLHLINPLHRPKPNT